MKREGVGQARPFPRSFRAFSMHVLHISTVCVSRWFAHHRSLARLLTQIVRGDYDAAVLTFKAALAHDPNQGELGVGFEQPIQDFLDPWMIGELKTGLRRAEHMAARKSVIEQQRKEVEARQRRKAEQLAELGRRKGKHWLVRAEAEAEAGAIRRAEEEKTQARADAEAQRLEEEQAAAILRRKELAAGKSTR